jgi:hypothetical protein
MDEIGRVKTVGQDLSEREIAVLEAVVQAYVETAEPAGSRTVARRSGLGVSPATIRNTMSDLEEKGYLSHPHTSAGRVPTDLAYRFHVDQLIRMPNLSAEDQSMLVRELGQRGSTVVDRLIRRAARALSLLSLELGVGLAPTVEKATLEKLDLLRVSSEKVLLVATIRSGLVRTLYVDFEGEIPEDTLATLTLLLNERLAGLTLREIRQTLPDRLRDFHPDDSAAAEELLATGVHVGGASEEPHRTHGAPGHPWKSPHPQESPGRPADYDRWGEHPGGAGGLHPGHLRIPHRRVEGGDRDHRTHPHALRKGDRHRRFHLLPGEPDTGGVSIPVPTREGNGTNIRGARAPAVRGAGGEPQDI